MYKISVPIINEKVSYYGKENYLQILKDFDSNRVFLALDCYELDKVKQRIAIKNLKENCVFFKSHGYEVGAWVWTFMFNETHPFVKMKTINGGILEKYACPMDKNFVSFATEYIKEIAKCGVDIIMFDDDFRYGFLGTAPACLCDKHISQICQTLGRETDIKEIRYNILNGGKNEYRDAYLAANRKGLIDFATSIRRAVDSINPDIRVGACCCMSSWDLDGTTPNEIAKILAGNTKPFARLIGAPYWAVNKSWGNDIHDAVELERMESSWSKTADIEIFAEGDAYPRPRMNCPASFIESFDTAIRASGCTDGILKYGIDYTSAPDYEIGYAKYHQKNKKLYSKIEEHFNGKTAVGIRVYEYPKKISNAVFEEETNITHLFFSNAARTLSNNAIPTVYEGNGVCGIVFGENARHIPQSSLENGLILDTQAAKILASRGVDVGIKSFGKKIGGGASEYFVKEDHHVFTTDFALFKLELNKNAEVLSTAKDNTPMTFRYENADGQRFLVINLDLNVNATKPLRTYARGKQIADNVQWLSNKKLPAYVYGHPSLYMQCKEDDSSLTIGLWNNFADVALEPIVDLSGEYSDVEFIQGNGKLCKDKLLLNDIPAYGFCGFTLKK